MKKKLEKCPKRVFDETKENKGKKKQTWYIQLKPLKPYQQ